MFVFEPNEGTGISVPGAELASRWLIVQFVRGNPGRFATVIAVSCKALPVEAGHISL
jgi:hypothetical protein